MKNFIRWGAYPVVFGTTVILQLLITSLNLPRWPLSLAVAGGGMLLVACLERVQACHQQWNADHDDTWPDIFHASFSLTLIFASLEIASLLQYFVPALSLWPTTMPIFLQVLLAGLIIDFGLWFMHWYSHKNAFLWRLHALHHSSERLYWLNGERRHPLSALLLAGPGMLFTVLLGAPVDVIACWYAIIAVHLAFQHANIDYSVGPLRHVLAVAEVHRWHHKREFEDAEVNFGEFWMLWDTLFGTANVDEHSEVQANDVGIREPMPLKYLQQISWPFRVTA